MTEMPCMLFFVFVIQPLFPAGTKSKNTSYSQDWEKIVLFQKEDDFSLWLNPYAFVRISRPGAKRIFYPSRKSVFAYEFFSFSCFQDKLHKSFLRIKKVKPYKTALWNSLIFDSNS